MTSTSDRLRWIADFLGLAGKAVWLSLVFVELTIPTQRDLRALAELLDARPPPCSPPRQPPEL
jgi:hypothetical protein